MRHSALGSRMASVLLTATVLAQTASLAATTPRLTEKQVLAVLPDAQICPCSGLKNCTGPRGGSYCITKNGTKRYRK
jgi:hypothetical protein